ncbi:MAG: PepSY-associated TM helix domain-containing protein [Cyclobacteriaceae bacterium]|nr:PepSY-associated TM helix domain-containing protein [Cyclobacteriaceae bacterium]
MMVKREVASWTRWLHIYLSMFSFATLLFFAVTGVTLNHTNWIEGQQKIEQLTGELPLSWVQTNAARVDELEVVEYFRNTHNIKSRLKDFLTDDAECTVSFKGPGYSADAFVDRATGSYELTITKSGTVAILNDLHKGRDTGTTWAWLIDISAVLMIFVSLTGFLMIFFLAKKKLSGLLLTGAGAVIMVLLYFLFAR